jgi:hypothetical protein
VKYIKLYETYKTIDDSDLRIGEYVICINNSTCINSGKEIDFYKDLLTVGEEYEIIDLPELNGIPGRLITVIGDNGKRINVSAKRFKVQDFMARGKRTGLWDLKKESSDDPVIFDSEGVDIKKFVYDEIKKHLNYLHLAFNEPITNEEYKLMELIFIYKIAKVEQKKKEYEDLILGLEDNYEEILEEIKQECLKEVISQFEEKPSLYIEIKKRLETSFLSQIEDILEAVPEWIKRSERTGLWDFNKFKKEK